jgi:hypothetical protein
MSDAVLTPEKFAALFHCHGTDLPETALQQIKKSDTRHREPSRAEWDEYLLDYAKKLRADWIERDTEQNREAFEKGWAENLQEIRKKGVSDATLKPKYFRGSKFLRLKKSLVVSPNPQIEFDLFVAARHYLYTKYLQPFDHLYEIGCGSCHNLWMLTHLFPKKIIHGFDWVNPSAEIANLIGKSLNHPVTGSLLDMLNPPADFNLKPNSAVITIHALEQIGDRHGPLIDALLKAKPKLVLHYEPIVEFYDEHNLLDYLAIWYSQKRRYLNGLLPALQKLAEEKKIEIIDAYRPELGGVVHEASLIVWKPI